MRIITFLFFLLSCFLYSQSGDELFDGLFKIEDNDQQKLLPEKMILTQSLLCGEKVFFRKTGI